MKTKLHLTICLALSGFTPSVAGPVDTTRAATPTKPDIKVSLVADNDSVTPGGTVTLGLHFKIQEGWHIYWRYAGDAGRPPTVRWQLPDGVELGPLQFPVPRRHLDRAGLTTYILEDEPVLLAELSAPAHVAPGQTLRIRGDVDWVACKQLCVRGSTAVSLDLPVVDAPAKQRAANEELFELARDLLPSPISDAKYVKVSTALSSSAVHPGDAAAAALVLDVAKGHHIQSNRPASEFFIATEVIVEPAAGLEIGKPAFPKPRLRTDRTGRKQSEFAGRAVIRIPLKAKPEFRADQVLRGLVTFQVCNDETGLCFAPQTVEWSLPVAYAGPGQPVEKTKQELFAAADQSETETAMAGTDAPASASGDLPRWPLWKILLFAFIGGTILNIMPCVLPVISIKILSFVQQAGDDPKRVFRLGLTYGGGILASFLAMAIGVLVLKHQGRAAGWGYMMASPTFVQAMIVVIFVFGLSLFGVFMISLPGSTTTALSAAEEREGYSGAFVKGILATALATPCTAPLLAPALGFAFALPSAQMLLSLMTVGLGLAAPYVVLTAVPGWLRFLPKPGPWMERFKQFMGFVLMGTVVWLLWILARLGDPMRVVWIVAFCCFLGVSLWLIGLLNVNTGMARRAVTWLSAVAISVGGFYYCFLHKPVQLEWRDWRPGLARALASQGYTVYVDFTAVWCATCQANKKLVLDTEDIRNKLAEMQVVLLKADYTRYDPAITAELERHGRAGVPLNIILPAKRPDDAILLPTLLTKAIVLDKLAQAGPSIASLEELEAAPPGERVAAQALPAGGLP